MNNPEPNTTDIKPIHRRAIIHFIDGTSLALEWPKQDLSKFTFVSEAIRKALESRQLMVEVEGHLLVIHMSNVKYIELVPAPDKLPEGTIREARHVMASVPASTA